jgi:hypothetical protein
VKIDQNLDLFKFFDNFDCENDTINQFNINEEDLKVDYSPQSQPHTKKHMKKKRGAPFKGNVME